MKPEEIKYFAKSGNRVRLIKRCGKAQWVVERVDGVSKGKQMLCNERSLVENLDEGAFFT